MVGSGIDEGARRGEVPLAPHAQRVHAPVQEGAQPALAVRGAPIEGGVVERVEEADAGQREVPAVEREARAVDAEGVGGAGGASWRSHQASATATMPPGAGAVKWLGEAGGSRGKQGGLMLAAR